MSIVSFRGTRHARSVAPIVPIRNDYYETGLRSGSAARLRNTDVGNSGLTADISNGTVCICHIIAVFLNLHTFGQVIYTD